MTPTPRPTPSPSPVPSSYDNVAFFQFAADLEVAGSTLLHVLSNHFAANTKLLKDDTTRLELLDVLIKLHNELGENSFVEKLSPFAKPKLKPTQRAKLAELLNPYGLLARHMLDVNDISTLKTQEAHVEDVLASKATTGLLTVGSSVITYILLSREKGKKARSLLTGAAILGGAGAMAYNYIAPDKKADKFPDEDALLKALSLNEADRYAVNTIFLSFFRSSQLSRFSLKDIKKIVKSKKPEELSRASHVIDSYFKRSNPASREAFFSVFARLLIYAPFKSSPDKTMFSRLVFKFLTTNTVLKNARTTSVPPLVQTPRATTSVKPAPIPAPAPTSFDPISSLLSEDFINDPDTQAKKNMLHMSIPDNLTSLNQNYGPLFTTAKTDVEKSHLAITPTVVLDALSNGYIYLEADYDSTTYLQDIKGLHEKVQAYLTSKLVPADLRVVFAGPVETAAATSGGTTTPKFRVAMVAYGINNSDSDFKFAPVKSTAFLSAGAFSSTQRHFASIDTNTLSGTLRDPQTRLKMTLAGCLVSDADIYKGFPTPTTGPLTKNLDKHIGSIDDSYKVNLDALKLHINDFDKEPNLRFYSHIAYLLQELLRDSTVNEREINRILNQATSYTTGLELFNFLLNTLLAHSTLDSKPTMVIDQLTQALKPPTDLQRAKCRHLILLLAHYVCTDSQRGNIIAYLDSNKQILKATGDPNKLLEYATNYLKLAQRSLAELKIEDFVNTSAKVQRVQLTANLKSFDLKTPISTANSNLTVQYLQSPASTGVTWSGFTPALKAGDCSKIANGSDATTHLYKLNNPMAFSTIPNSPSITAYTTSTK